MKEITAPLLVRKAAKGDTSAFAELYSMIYKDLYYIALSSLGDPDDAADCVEDAVLDAFVSISKLRDEEAFKGWMIKILLAKIKRKQKEYCERKNIADIDETEAKDYNNAFSGVEISQALSTLTAAERECVALKYISGYKGEEITKLTGIAHTTVRSHLSRARQKLKAFLLDDEEDDRKENKSHER